MSTQGSAPEDPWSTDATVIVDVASLAHRIAEDVTGWLGFDVKVDGWWSPQFRLLRDAVIADLDRVVPMLEPYGVVTRRLLLGMPLHRFPPPVTGWRATEDGERERAEQVRAERIDRYRQAEQTTRQRLRETGHDAVAVSVLDGYFSTDGEHCIDELCVLAAASESWRHPERTVHVITWDADVSVAPWVAGEGRILLTRDLNGDERKRLLSRMARHRPDHLTENRLPPHLALMVESFRTFVRPGSLPHGSAVRELLAQRQAEVPAVRTALVTGDDGLQLIDVRDPDRRLTDALDRPHPQRWVTKRREALLDPPTPLGAAAVVDTFGLMTTATRSRVPTRAPTSVSVDRALAPLGIDAPLAQLAAIPDVLNADHGLLRIADNLDGAPILPSARERMLRPIRAALRRMDRGTEKATDGYRDDGRLETISTTTAFAPSRLDRIGSRPDLLEEKESATFLAADLLWLLQHTDLPVLLLSDRPDLVVMLHRMSEFLPEDARIEQRVLRIGMHADTFTGDGITVARSNEVSSWPTMLLTERMLVELFRLSEADDSEGGRQRRRPSGPTLTDVIAYDPISNMFDVLSDGGAEGPVSVGEVARLPMWEADDATGATDEAEQNLHDRLTAQLELHLDLRGPLPRPVLARPRLRDGVVRAVRTTAEVTGHGDGVVRIRLATTDGPPRREVKIPLPSMSIAKGSTIDVVVEVSHDADGACTLILPDLREVPHELGHPRPATLLDQNRVRLDEPFDPDDRRTDVGTAQRSAPLHGPFIPPRSGEQVMVTERGDGRVQIVSTALPASLLRGQDSPGDGT